MRALAPGLLAVALVAAGCDCRGAKLTGLADAGCTAERCDGLDNDCNGLVDDGLPTQRCGVGACARTVESCIDGEPSECQPGAAVDERCDGEDNDCDGEVDEGLPPVTCGVGACATSVAACAAGTPQNCTPLLPTAEACDGLDNDCNGSVDDALAPQRCGVGACARTAEACVSGAVPACVPGAPTTEVCDDVDNDCDGVIDEGFTRISCGVGACARSVSACTAGQVPTCTPGSPVPEVCDGLDNDCDGTVDESLAPLSCGVGACARMAPACIAGVVQSCMPGAPAAEVCDGLDNDCNGVVDEGLLPLSCGQGACRRMVAACAGGAVQTCTPGTPSAELCDGLDNNCNGQVDEGLSPLTCGVGVCARSVAACVGGAPQTCTPGAPSAEVCDGLDNNCSGQSDEGVCLPPVVACPAPASGRAGTPLTLTASASNPEGGVVTTAWTVTARPPGSTAAPASPGASTTSFTPDVAGTFTLSFCATNDRGRVTCCTTTVVATVCTAPPAPPVSTACGTSWDGRPIVQFAPVPAGLSYALTRAGDSTVLASAAAGENYLRPATRLAVGAAPPGLATDLSVQACRVADPTCCSAPAPLQVSVVAECAVPTAPTSATVVLSEYVINGEGMCPSPDCVTQDTCQAGEAVEMTNLSNCPVSLDGFHFAYRNASASTSSLRWMNFGAADVIPPRGVYVAIRNKQYAPTCSAALGTERPGIFGLKVSSLSMQGPNLCSGWFNNTGGGSSELQLASGTIASAAALSFTPAAAVARVAPYLPTSGSSPACTSIGFDAVDSCGAVLGGSAPTQALSPNQLGRLWHPCDAVLAPVPACVRD